MKKRILAGILTLVMVICLLPVTAMAENGNVARIGTEEYATLDAAVRAAKTGDEIVLLTDSTGVSIKLDETRSRLTINLNGYAIDGGNTHRCIYVYATRKNAEDQHVLTVKNGTLKNGSDVGSAINCLCNLVVENCQIEGNQGTAVALASTTGTAEAKVTNTTFEDNHTAENHSGGAFSVAQNSHAELMDCKFINNSAGSMGGAIYCDHGSITITDCSFVDNKASYGGAIAGAETDISIRHTEGKNTMIERNVASMMGGGIHIQGVGKNAGKLEVEDVVIQNNQAAYGGAVSVFNSNAAIKGTIIDNTASAMGGGCYNASNSGIESVLDLKEAAVYNNEATSAGADIFNFGDTSTVLLGVTDEWTLKNCEHTIDGWYLDDSSVRWSAHDDPAYTEKFEDATAVGRKALKAAHDQTPDDPMGVVMAGLWLNTNDHYSYLIGYSDGTVRPNGKITRAEVATIFFRLLDDDTRAKYWSSENNFSDVSADKWYNNAVSTLCNMGVIGGYADGTFRPDAPISRAEFAKIAVSFTQNNGSTTYNYFTDVKTTDWFAPYVTAAKDAGLIEGYSDGSFKPESEITRAEACAIVNRTLGRKPSKAHMKISDRIDWPDVQTTDWFYEAIMEATNSHTYQMGKRVETWNDKLPQRDWAALETGWANAYTGNGGEVR